MALKSEGTKMNCMGKYYHNLPWLAKEYGFTFQLHRGKINWNDINSLNIQEIIEDRNFYLLEQNLVHVINCNLETEYDVRILDQNFVKLFKIAQMGIDYLSFLELYLDGCTLILEKQLSSCQEELILLRKENDRKENELRRIRNKHKIQTQKFKCNKCNKLFWNETYLESHEKRRHENVSEAGKDRGNASKTFINREVQTDTEKITNSASVQTTDEKLVLPNDESPVPEESESSKMKEQELKINHLKKDLEELKIRINFAEKMMEKKYQERTSENDSWNTVVPVFHSHISPSNGYHKINSSASVLVHDVPDCFSKENKEAENKVNRSRLNELSAAAGSSRLVLKSANAEESAANEYITPKRISCGDSVKIHDNDGMFKNPCYEDLSIIPHPEKYVNVEGKNMTGKDAGVLRNPDNEFVSEMNPGKDKTKSGKQQNNGDVSKDFQANESPLGSCSNFRFDSEFSIDTVCSLSSTSTKNTEKTGETVDSVNSRNFNVISLSRSNSEVSKIHRKNESGEAVLRGISFEDAKIKSSSFFEKIVSKTSYQPRIRGLSANLKNSLTHMYGSVSSGSKENLKVRKANLRLKSKSDIVENFRNRLRALGIDPEWRGVPKETMEQKLKILEHRRHLSSKKNRLYGYLRRKLNKSILQFKISKGKVPMEVQIATSPNTETNIVIQDVSFPEGANERAHYESDGSDTNILDKRRESDCSCNSSEDNLRNIPSDPSVQPREKSRITREEKNKEETKEIDFTIFQVNKLKGTKLAPEESRRPDVLTNEVDELETDSDSCLGEDFATQGSCILTEYSDKTNHELKESIATFPAKPEIRENGPARFLEIKLKTNSNNLDSEAVRTESFLNAKKGLFAVSPAVSEKSTKSVVHNFNSSEKASNNLSTVFDYDNCDDDDWSLESKWKADAVK